MLPTPAPSRSAARRRALGISIAAVTATTSLVFAGPAAPANARTAKRTIATGVTLTHSTFTLKSGSHRLAESVYALHVTLGAHIGLDAASPGNAIGHKRATALTIARQEHALAGVNGDTFYFKDSTAVPRGGLTHDGVLLKSALQHKNAALWVNTAGKAGIGDPGFDGYAYSGKHRFHLLSANSLENAKNGGTSIINSAVASAPLPRCTQLTLTSTGPGAFQVASVRTGVRRFDHLPANRHAIVTCSKTASAWLRSKLGRGSKLTASWGYRHKETTVLSGVNVLVRNGRSYHDRTGLNVYGKKHMPEAFACTMRDGKHLLLGAVEGKRKGAAGMTYTELARYLVGQHCWSAMALDGSDDSTVVASSGGRHLAVANKPSGGTGPRRIVDGLYVVRR